MPPGSKGQITGPDRGLACLEAFVETTIRDLPLHAHPGAVWGYNHAAFTIAGRVLEVVSGRDIHTALQELVFAPLSINHSFTRIVDVVTQRFTQGHPGAAGTTARLLRQYALSSSFTAGGVAMSMANAISYGAFHLAGENSTVANSLRCRSQGHATDATLNQSCSCLRVSIAGESDQGHSRSQYDEGNLPHHAQAINVLAHGVG
jgi:CubicO group peptidase (beta-lactamase class C family)